jgi:two-component system, sensor histidine kinase and response regulator
VDLAILDFQMPVIDGCQLAREIHALDNCKQLPLILLSSSLPSLSADVGTIEEFAVRVMKPIKQADLFDALTTALGTINLLSEPFR